MSPSMARTTIISGGTKNRSVACGGGRRLEEYRKAEPAWEIVLDLDQLAGVEKENWVWKGADMLRPSHDRALLFLSRGGADAAVTREFDLGKKEFVARRVHTPGGEKPGGLAPSRCHLHRQRFRSGIADEFRLSAGC